MHSTTSILIISTLVFESFTSAIKADPNNMEYVWQQCSLYEQLGEHRKALDGYQHILKILPPDSGTHYMQLARSMTKVGVSLAWFVICYTKHCWTYHSNMTKVCVSLAWFVIYYTKHCGTYHSNMTKVGVSLAWFVTCYSKHCWTYHSNMTKVGVSLA